LTKYWIHFTGRFGGVHAFAYNSAKSEDEIWSTVSTLLGGGLADFGRDPRRRPSDSFRGRRNFLVR